VSTPIGPDRPQEHDTQSRGGSAPPPRPLENAWALRIATVAGIPIRLHFTFLLFLVYVGLAGRGGSDGLSVLYVLAIFACVVLHELGHSIVALRYGIPVADITLYPIGGVARIEKQPKPRQELWIAVAGPAVNVVIGLILWVAIGMPSAERIIADMKGGIVTPHLFAEGVMGANIWLVAFNLIPAFPMDGGRVLRAMLGMNMPVERATAIAAGVGQFLAILFGIWAAFSGAWILLFIAFFVYIGAGQEAFAYRHASLIDGVRVRQAMITDVRTLTVGNTLKEAADVLLDTSQHDFPVMHGSEVQGVLTRNGLLRALAEAGPGAYVAGAMNREFASAGPDDDLAEILPRLQAQGGPLVVLDLRDGNKVLLGIVTGENVQEFFAVRQIVAARDRQESKPNG
jgi:Zn-dependent protease/CBS domain-containing protein